MADGQTVHIMMKTVKKNKKKTTQNGSDIKQLHGN